MSLEKSINAKINLFKSVLSPINDKINEAILDNESVKLEFLSYIRNEMVDCFIETLSSKEINFLMQLTQCSDREELGLDILNQLL